MEVKQEVNKAIRLSEGSELASSRNMLPFLLSEKVPMGPWDGAMAWGYGMRLWHGMGLGMGDIDDHRYSELDQATINDL